MFLTQATHAESDLDKTVEEGYDADEDQVEEGLDDEPRGYLGYQHDGQLSSSGLYM